MNKVLATVAAAAVITGTSLVPGSVNAQTKFLELEVKPICVVAASDIAVWEVNNKNSQTISFDWVNTDTSFTGEYAAPAGVTSFTTNYDGGHPNNRTEFYGTRSDDQNPISRNATNVECTADQIPVDNGGGNGGGTTPNPDNGGGRGGDGAVAPAPATPAASTQLPSQTETELANTGASTVMALGAASVVALFTAASVVLVRKGIL